MPTKVRKPDARPIDPNCGKPLHAEKRVKLSWEGKTYYFCSEECRRRFEQDPAGAAWF